MGVGELLPNLRGLRFRVLVHDYEGHPAVPPGTVVNALGDPRQPDFLVIELDSAINVPQLSGPGLVPIRHLAVSPIGWDWEALVHAPVHFTPLFVKVWHVFDPRLATSQEWSPETMVYVAKGSLARVRQST